MHRLYIYIIKKFGFLIISSIFVFLPILPGLQVVQAAVVTGFLAQTYADGTGKVSWSPAAGISYYDVAAGRPSVDSTYCANTEFGWFANVGASVSLQKLPTDGSSLCVRVFPNGDTPASDYFFSAYKSTPTASTTFSPTPPPSYQAPFLLTPTPNSVLTGASAVFTWTDEGANSYYFLIGKGQRYTNIGVYRNLKTTTLTVNNLPSDGSQLKVRIIARFSTGYKWRDFILYAYSIPPNSTSSTVLSAVWVNNGEDKVTRDELRATKNSTSVYNSVWDGGKIKIFGGKNEVINFNLILEAGNQTASNLSVLFDKLTGPNGATISSVPASGNGVFDWTNRNIELFYVKYLQIKGLSRMAYETYDERHIPQRLRRPFIGAGVGSGVWTDRPDHDKYYPDIAIPLELNPTFTVSAGQNQSIWADIYIPKSTPAGVYYGTVSVKENGIVTRQIPVELTVRNFMLPDTPTAKTMVYISRENISKRYTGNPWPNQGTAEDSLSKQVRDRHFLLAHRHKLSLIDGDIMSGDQPSAEWGPRLNGSLFISANGYAGPGEGIGNGVYSIGTYGSWSWKGEGEAGMRKHSDGWVNWFADNSPATEYFLYLIDESSDYPQIQIWSSWIQNNPGFGKTLKSFVTAPLPSVLNFAPALDIAASWLTVGDMTTWQNAMNVWKSRGTDKRFYLYNGKRPANGSFATEDDGVALRELAWAQYKKGIDRWFKWESTYYNDYQSGRGETNVFQNAQTFGGTPSYNSVLGQTGWNYANGDGVLFYPGTDKVYLTESFNVAGPFASLRLKYWRRGIQDVDYLALAAKINPVKAQEIAQRMAPKAFWEYGINDPNDPTWVTTDISWSVNPNDWEAARAELAGIIEGA